LYYDGQGVLQDYVQAHLWMNLAASRAKGDYQKKYANARDLVAGKMASQQISEAQRRAREWKPKSGAGQGGRP
jgi:TPR repeat protein